MFLLLMKCHFLFGFGFFTTISLNTNNNLYSKNTTIPLIGWRKKKFFWKNRTANLC